MFVYIDKEDVLKVAVDENTAESNSRKPKAVMMNAIDFNPETGYPIIFDKEVVYKVNDDLAKVDGKKIDTPPECEYLKNSLLNQNSGKE